MTLSLKDKMGVALFVEEELTHLKPNSALIMIITPEPLGAFCVRSVTGMSLDDIVKVLGQTYLEELMSI